MTTSIQVASGAAVTDLSLLTPADFAHPTFESVEAFYTEILERPVSPEGFHGWLADINTLDASVQEASVKAKIAYDLDTNNAAAREHRDLWMNDILPRLTEVGTAIIRRVLAFGITPPGSEIAFANMAVEEKLFRSENIPLESEESELESCYDNLLGSAVIEVDGRIFTLPEVGKELESDDREYRERIWRAEMVALEALRPALRPIWKRLWEVRTEQARNAGFANYRDYVWESEPTLGYGPPETARFYESVSTAARPVLERIRARRRDGLGVDTLRPWDLSADVFGRAPIDLGPGAARSLAISAGVLRAVDPAIGDLLSTLSAKDLLDLDNRPGKTPGGYQEELAFSGLPFIFMNAVGSSQDVQTVVHEMGHAYHTIVSGGIPFLWDRNPGEEMAEVASMSMELMAYEHMTPETTGLSAAEVSRLRAEHFEDILSFFGHCTTMDRLQHEVYAHPDGWDLDVADAIYDSLSARVNTGVDWRGVEAFRHLRWHYQAHVWTTPFYYIQYGLAQLVALSLWESYRLDPSATFARYTAALALGGRRSLPDLFKAAGSSLDFSHDFMSGALSPALEALEAHWAVVSG